MTDQSKSGLAKTSFMFGFISLFFLLGIITAIPGIITGHLARSRAIHYPHQYGGSRVAMLGLIMSYTSIGVLVLLVAIGNHLHSNGDLIPFLETVDETNTMSTYAKVVIDNIPFTHK